MTPEQARDVHDAVLAYWTSRDEAALRQASKGVSDAGERSGATSGAHLDRVAQLLGRVCIAAGAPPEEVYYKAPADDPYKRENISEGYTLPGYYRPTKQWDVVVRHDGKPIVVIELKSQNGPSYSNNANNRAEEAIGNAVDLRRAKEAGLVPGNPWTAYAFVIEDDERSRGSDRAKDRGFHPKDEIFAGWSYISRVCLLSRRLVEDGHYDAAWVLATSRPTCPATVKEPKRCAQIKFGIEPHGHRFGWFEPDPGGLGYVSFITDLTRQIERYYKSGPAIGQPQLSLFD
ncbi:PaeR7I family type II restriction endonuclease [Micromonospora echinospora]|uniref:PaeR7I family type II restriction endonuclease n=1 Tax=Micromonospora echinospora TaxID=1877 RepID=UPI0033F94935